ncbi:MAG: hypothetical protein ACOC2T_00830 [Planctomycetota bacterium]
MKRIMHRSHSHEEAARWDVQQHQEMTPKERMAVAKELIDQFYGRDTPDVRENRIWTKKKIHA